MSREIWSDGSFGVLSVRVFWRSVLGLLREYNKGIIRGLVVELHVLQD